MKKLFTLLALMACFLGANAKEVVDAEVNFSEQSEIKYYGWGGSELARERLSLQDGCLFYHGESATENAWDAQFFPIGGVDVEVGVTYTLKLKIKGSADGPFWNISFAGVDKYGIFNVTTDWQELEFQYEATGTSGDALFQCGSYVGDWWIEYIKISHEEREQAPVEWVNILENGDASGEFGEVPCAYSKEFGYNDNNPHPALIEDGMFVSHAKTVDPVLVWDSDGEQWGQQHSAGDPMPDNSWQNQFWINFPRPLKEGESVKLSFRYKASKDNIRVTTQDHKTPGDYLGGGKVGELTFNTDWQTCNKEFSAAAGVQSIAFNFGEDNHYLEDIDFYFDDLNVSLMKLEEGFFAASTNTETGLVEYNFDQAVKFEYDEAEEAYVATVGTKGKEETWVNELMISTARGNDKGFKAGTLKVSGNVANDEWMVYSEAANAKIKLPAAGVWTIYINPDYEMVKFVQVEGDEIVVVEPIDIVANPAVIVVHGQERDFTATEQPADEEAGVEAGTGQPWDNQFFILANRPLVAGEETYIEFDYVGSIDAKTTTQDHRMPGDYVFWNSIGDVNFTTEEQHFSAAFTVPSDADGMQSIAFNMAEIKEACDYTIKNVIWKLADDTESLINMTGTDNFFVKEGAGTEPYQAADPAGINNVVVNSAVAGAIYNLAGQRVNKEYKGIVVKNGKKYIAK